MGSYHQPSFASSKCKHGRLLFQRCFDCDEEREVERIAELRRVHNPAQVIRDAVEARRPWYRRCAFCTHESEIEHDKGCPWHAQFGILRLVL